MHFYSAKHIRLSDTPKAFEEIISALLRNGNFTVSIDVPSDENQVHTHNDVLIALT